MTSAREGEARGRVALVTGASRGIGAAIARRLAAEGARVAVTARSAERHPHLPGSLEETVAAIRAGGGEAVAIPGDLADADVRRHVVEETERSLGAIDVLVNNAAAAFYMPFEKYSEKRFRIAFELNVRAPFELAQLVLPGMRSRKCGWILNVSSATAIAPTGPPFHEFAVKGGALLYVYRDGLPVVDVHGGLADRDAGRPWHDDTLELVFSATKGVTAACVLLLAERGRLDLDAPVAEYWPEFAARGKERIPARWILSHTAGLAAIEADLTLEQALAWDPVVTALAAQAPNWEPGTRHGYHLRSYGWLLGEIVRRVTGRSIGRFLADEIAAPLGLDFWIGLPAAEEPRVARIIPPDPPPEAMREVLERLFAPDTLAGRAFTGPSGLFHYDEMWNRRELHACELPSSNGIGSAHALARFHAALIGEVDGVRVLREDTVAAARVVQSEGADAVLLLPTRFGLGFMLPPALCAAAGPSAFGHPGAGGSLGLADPDAGLALGYVTNRMMLGATGDPRAERLVAAAYAAAASSPRER